MHRNTTISLTKIAALVALVAVIGTASTAFAAQTGYGPVQLATAQQIDDPAGPRKSEDTAPVITHAMAPRYPEIALAEGLEGFSTVTFTMALDGSVPTSS
jgi:outer membrane biosynthesis protein TonB